MNVKKLIEEQDAKELVKSFVLPLKLNKKEKQQADDQLRHARKQLRAKASEQDFLKAGLMQLRFQLEDYIRSDRYDPSKKFGNFLNAYLQVVRKKASEFARDISVHKTLISQLINNSRDPNETIVIRLELHSNNNIPAEYWLQLVQKEKVYQLRINKQLRKQEKQNVVDKVPVKI